MKPIKCTENDGKYKYHYSYINLKTFLKQGYLTGDVGLILVEQDEKYDIYRGFGTIENPYKQIQTLSIAYNKDFDGERITFNKMYEIKKPSLESYRFTILNFNNI